MAVCSCDKVLFTQSVQILSCNNYETWIVQNEVFCSIFIDPMVSWSSIFSNHWIMYIVYMEFMKIFVSTVLRLISFFLYNFNVQHFWYKYWNVLNVGLLVMVIHSFGESQKMIFSNDFYWISADLRLLIFLGISSPPLPHLMLQLESYP